MHRRSGTLKGLWLHSKACTSTSHSPASRRSGSARPDDGMLTCRVPLARRAPAQVPAGATRSSRVESALRSLHSTQRSVGVSNDPASSVTCTAEREAVTRTRKTELTRRVRVVGSFATERCGCGNLRTGRKRLVAEEGVSVGLQWCNGARCMCICTRVLHPNNELFEGLFSSASSYLSATYFCLHVCDVRAHKSKCMSGGERMGVDGCHSAHAKLSASDRLPEAHRARRRVRRHLTNSLAYSWTFPAL